MPLAGRVAFFALAALGFPIWASADPIITVTNLSLASTRAEACDAAGCTYTDNTWHSGDALLSTAESTARPATLTPPRP